MKKLNPKQRLQESKFFYWQSSVQIQELVSQSVNLKELGKRKSNINVENETFSSRFLKQKFHSKFIIYIFQYLKKKMCDKKENMEGRKFMIQFSLVLYYCQQSLACQILHLNSAARSFPMHTHIISQKP